MNYLVYLAYGRKDLMQECIYSLYTLKKYISFNQNFKVVVFTDNVDYFKKLIPDEVSLVYLDKDKQTQLSGSYQFRRKVKLELIKEYLNQPDTNLLYVDSCTSFQSDPTPLFDRINNGEIIISRFEGVIAKLTSEKGKKINKFLQGSRSTSVVRIAPSATLLNSGIFGCNSSAAELIDKVIYLAETWYKIYPKSFVEDLAITYYFQKEKADKVQTTNGIVFHYKGFREFRRVLNDFFTRHENSSANEILTKIDRINPETLIVPKQEYENLPYLFKLLRKIKGKRWQMPEYKL